MPALDRRITVRRTVTTFDDHGTAVETMTDFPLWATRIDASLIDAATEGGQLNTATRKYRIRYNSVLADAAASELDVIEGDLTLSVNNIIEQGDERVERRRFLVLETVGEVTP